MTLEFKWCLYETFRWKSVPSNTTFSLITLVTYLARNNWFPIGRNLIRIQRRFYAKNFLKTLKSRSAYWNKHISGNCASVLNMTLLKNELTRHWYFIPWVRWVHKGCIFYLVSDFFLFIKWKSPTHTKWIQNCSLK